jgi:hypothetical protein
MDVQKLKESERMKDATAQERLQALEARVQKQQKERVELEDRHNEEYERLKKAHVDELQTVQKDCDDKCKAGGNTLASMKLMKEQAERQLRDLTVEFNEFKTRQANEVAERDKAFRAERDASIRNAVKEWDAKLKTLEASREEANEKNADLNEKLAEAAKTLNAVTSKDEMELAKLKEDNLHLHKQNVELLAELEKQHNEAQMGSTSLAVGRRTNET